MILEAFLSPVETSEEKSTLTNILVTASQRTEPNCAQTLGNKKWGANKHGLFEAIKWVIICYTAIENKLHISSAKSAQNSILYAAGIAK